MQLQPIPADTAIPDQVAMLQAIDRLHDQTAFYTLDPVVDQLLDMLRWPEGDRTIADVACGDGAFIIAALKRLLTSEPNATAPRVVALIHGWEIHAEAVQEARRRVAEVLCGHGWDASLAWSVSDRTITHGDYLLDGPTVGTWDCVAANPPFLRYANVPEILRERYEAIMPGYSQGDMLHSFLDHCVRGLTEDGEIALVTSDRWLFSHGAAKLRGVIGQRLELQHLERLDCASSFYRPKNRRAGQPPRIHPVAIHLRRCVGEGRAITEEPIYPDADDSAYVGLKTLGELAQIRLAPWLGKHGLFVVDQDTATAAGIPQQLLVPAVDTDNIRGGVLSRPTKYAIRTLRREEPPHAVMRHLDANMHLLAKTKVRKVCRWIPPESFEQVDLSQPSLLIPRIAASLRPVLIPAGILPIDHGLSIVRAGATGPSLEALAGALARPEAEAWVRARAPRLENGYFSVTTTLLRQLPLPL
jgi:hypothetical protein